MTPEQATNWARNVAFTASRRERPRELPALQRLVAAAPRVRALGTGHSFTAIADTPGLLVSLAGLPRTVRIDPDRATVEVTGMWTYGGLAHELHAAGWALPNMGSLPHISLAGACSTGTHGSGARNRALGSSVRRLTLLTGTGDLLTIGRDHPDFGGSVLALGRLGIVVSMTLDLVPAFSLEQRVVEAVPDEVVEHRLEDVLASAYSVSVFTTWGPDRLSQLWVKAEAGAGPVHGHWDGVEADGPRHPVAGMPTENATEQLGVPGPWHERLPHFRMEFTPSSGDELQSEYLVPMTQARAAWRAVHEIRDAVTPHLHVSEIRAVDGDPMWLSLTGGRPSAAFHFTWRPGPGVLPAVAALEAQLEPFDARPHWGKVFSTPPDALERLYPRMSDFRDLVQRMDPAGKFGNDLVDGWIGLRL